MRQTLTSIIILALLALATSTAFAQGNPNLFIRPIVAPDNPTTSDAVKLYFFARTGVISYRINTSFFATGHDMTFTGCYQIGFSTNQSRFMDSVSVGQLPMGTYTLSFIGVEAGGGSQPCVGGRRDTVSVMFQVRGPLATTRAGEGGWAVYPMPTVGGALSLIIPSDKQVTSITLLDAMGRACYASPGTTLLPQGGRWQLQLPTLPAGAYTLELGVAGGAVVAQRVLLE